MLLIELDSEGDTLWTSVLGGTGSEVPAAMIMAPDEGIWIGLTTFWSDTDETEATLLRLDSSMDTVWCSRLPGSRRAADILLLDNGNCLMIGTHGEGSSMKGMAALFNQSGDTLWTAEYSNGSRSRLTSAATMDEGAVCCGSSTGPEGTEGWFIRLDPNGIVTSESTFGTGGMTEITGIITTPDGCLMAGSGEGSESGVTDMLLVMTDSIGSPLRETTYGGSGWDRSLGLCQAGEGYLIWGYSRSITSGEVNRSELYMVRTDRQGVQIWEQTHGTGKSDYCWSATPCSDVGYVMAGSVTDYSGTSWYDAWVLRVDSLGQLSQQSIEPHLIEASLTAGPAINPCTGSAALNLTLESGSEVDVLLFDVLGRLIAAPVSDIILPRGDHTLMIPAEHSDGSPLPAGVYVLQVRACGGEISFGITILGK